MEKYCKEIIGSTVNQTFELQIAQLLFSKSVEKYERKNRIIEAPNMSNSEKNETLELLDANYNQLRKEIIENSALVIASAATLLFLYSKRNDIENLLKSIEL